MAHANYETLFDPSAEDLVVIERGLHEFNLARLGEKVIHDYAKLAILARDENGNVIGGIHAELVWEWL